MKKRIFVVISTLCMILCASNCVYALTPTYELSDSYKNGQYYRNLMNVTLTGNQKNDIINVALSQYGYTEGNYSGDYGGASNGSNNYTEYQRMPGVTSGQGIADAGWCAAFVSWCARQAGIPTSIIGNSTTSSISNFGLSKSNTPKQGSLAFVQFDSDVNIDHTALVYDVDSTYVYTIEGNRNNKVEKKKYYKSTGEQVNYSATYIEFYGNPSYIESQPSLGAPTITSVSTVSTSSLKVTWNSVSGATAYRIDRRRSGDEAYSTIVSSTTSTSYTDIGLLAGEKYYYRVYALNGSVTSDRSESTGAYTQCEIPEITSAVGESTSSITINWNYVNGASYYRIDRRKQTEDAYYTIVANHTGSRTYTDTGLVSGSKYYYRVYAVNENSTSEKPDGYGGYTQCEIPTITSVTANSPSSITIKWNGVNGADSYRIDRRTQVDDAYTTIVTGYTSKSYTDTGLEAGTKYYYRVYAVTEGSVSAKPDGEGTFTKYIYTINYNANGGSGAPGSQSKIEDSTLTLSSTKPIRTGYSFVNWNTEADGSGTAYNAGSLYTVNSGATLYAQWASDTYPVMSAPTVVRTDDTTLRVSWDVIDGTDSQEYIYRIYRKLPSDTSFANKSIAEVSGSSYYDDTDTDANQTYQYRVVLLDNDGNRLTYSDVGIGYPVMNSPVVASIDNTMLRISWDVMEEVDLSEYTYRIYRKLSDEASFANKMIAEVSDEAYYNDTYVEPNQTYQYRIVLVDKDNNRLTYSYIGEGSIIKKYSASNIVKNNTIYNIETKIYNINTSCGVIVVGYKEGKIVAFTSSPYNAEWVNTTLSGDIDEIKVMVWDKLSGLIPQCDAEVIPNSEFITE